MSAYGSGLWYHDPMTHGQSDRGGRVCRCANCGYVARCTVRDDFYTKPDDPTGLLYCERCITAKET